MKARDYILAVCLSIIFGLFITSFFIGKKQNVSDEQEIIKTVLPSSQKIYKLEFEGHTYVYLVNSFNHGGNAFLHDPGCMCHEK
jgi:hypothetical protein